jgi:hypothetical protein
MLTGGCKGAGYVEGMNPLLGGFCSDAVDIGACASGVAGNAGPGGCGELSGKDGLRAAGLIGRGCLRFSESGGVGSGGAIVERSQIDSGCLICSCKV